MLPTVRGSTDEVEMMYIEEWYDMVGKIERAETCMEEDDRGWMYVTAWLDGEQLAWYNTALCKWGVSALGLELLK